MDIAIVTGANTRIGLAISRKLIDIGCRVYGLGGNFDDFPLEHYDFIPVTCDLTKTEHLCRVVQEIIDKEKNIYVLVNHARYMNLSRHEELGLNDLESLVHTNLLAPLILTRLALPSLTRLRGYILNIGFPDLPGSHRLGSAFLSTEVALQQFSDRLYEEVRQDKVKVCSLILDTANAESLFKEGFTERDNHDLIVCSEATAQAVDYVISQKRESVVSRLVIRPQKREPDSADRAEARKITPPKAFVTQKPARKVVIGRLKKEAPPEPDEKGPATYMDMAREIAKEEAQRSEQRQNQPETAQSRRRRRSRGRRRRPQESGGKQPDKLKDSTENRPSSKVPSRAPKNSEKGGAKPAGKTLRKKPIKEDTNTSAPVKKRPAKKVARKQPLAKKTPAKKKDSPSKDRPKPAVKKEDLKKVNKKVPAKKTARKRAAKKAAQKVVRKRATSRRKSD